MRPRHEYEEVHRWLAWGLNDCEISRLTNIPRKTIGEWRVRSRARLGTNCPRCEDVPLNEATYAYLLGLYLGDGHIVKQRRIYSLRITLDERYPGIIEECRRAIGSIRGGVAHAGIVQRSGCVSVVLGWNHWPCVFPQHGPGVKHARPMTLRSWQLGIADRHPDRLLRGLIHSDGWRGDNRVTVRGKTYAYPRYQFANHSEDIRAIFCRACDVYGVRWRQMKWNTISIARKDDVAKLDVVVGLKK
ncbi:MAG: hypothetical protein ACLGIB_09005 [Actinomycetota bacterium]